MYNTFENYIDHVDIYGKLPQQDIKKDRKMTLQDKTEREDTFAQSYVFQAQNVDCRKKVSRERASDTESRAQQYNKQQTRNKHIALLL